MVTIVKLYLLCFLLTGLHSPAVLVCSAKVVRFPCKTKELIHMRVNVHCTHTCMRKCVRVCVTCIRNRTCLCTHLLLLNIVIISVTVVFTFHQQCRNLEKVVK